MGLQHQPDVTHLRAASLCGNFGEILESECRNTPTFLLSITRLFSGNHPSESQQEPNEWGSAPRSGMLSGLSPVGTDAQGRRGCFNNGIKWGFFGASLL